MVNDMRNAMSGAYFYNDEMHDFNFYTDLSVYDKLAFVNSVVDLLVDESRYNSVLRSLIFDFNIIDMFTDIDTSALLDVKDEEDNIVNSIIVIEHILDSTNIVDIVVANMRDGLIDELNNAIDLNIEYLTGIHKNKLNDALSKLVNTLEGKISGIDIDSMMGMAQMFSGMTEDFTPDNIVNAYINSDTHKNNLVEVKEAKKTKGKKSK